MKRFEDLPENVRALILAKLGVELAAHNSPNVYHLAKIHQTDVMGVWREVCRKARQPVCTIPPAVTHAKQ